MLVLSRKCGEGITVVLPGGNIHFSVVGIRSDKVRIGIDADPSIPVHRDEVLRQIEAEPAMVALIDGETS